MIRGIIHTNYVAVAGFPNYHLGDSNYFIEGQVNGFSTISSIRHIQVSNILVEWNNGRQAMVKLLVLLLPGQKGLREVVQLRNMGLYQ